MWNTRVTVANYALLKTLKAAIWRCENEIPSEEPSSSISDCRTSLLHARL
jgi:hypothetical protein